MADDGRARAPLGALLHQTTGLEFWQLLVLVFLGSLLDAPGNTARSALVPDVVVRAGLPVDPKRSRGETTYLADLRAGFATIGLRPTFLMLGSLYVATALSSAINPGLREI